MSEEVILSSKYIDEDNEDEEEENTPVVEQEDQKIMLKRLRNQRAYHLKRINNPEVEEKQKAKNRQKLIEIIKKIAEITNKSVEEITNEYTKGHKGRPKKKQVKIEENNNSEN